MISHPLAYVAPNPRHLAPTVGLGAPSSGDLLWMGTLFLPGERSQPVKPDGVCTNALHGAAAACAASCLADLIGEIRLSNEHAPDAGAASSESCLIDLLGRLDITNEPAFDLESIGSTDPMLVDSDSASLDAFPTNVVVIDDPIPRADSGGSTVTEVIVIGHGVASGGDAQDPLQATMRDMSVPITGDANAETLEACRIALVESDKKLATMRHLTKAYQR